jgi:hypothetical protein
MSAMAGFTASGPCASISSLGKVVVTPITLMPAAGQDSCVQQSTR